MMDLKCFKFKCVEFSHCADSSLNTKIIFKLSNIIERLKLIITILALFLVSICNFDHCNFDYPKDVLYFISAFCEFKKDSFNDFI